MSSVVNPILNKIVAEKIRPLNAAWRPGTLQRNRLSLSPQTLCFRMSWFGRISLKIFEFTSSSLIICLDNELSGKQTIPGTTDLLWQKWSICWVLVTTVARLFQHQCMCKGIPKVPHIAIRNSNHNRCF